VELDRAPSNPTVLLLALGVAALAMVLEFAVARRQGRVVHDWRESAASFVIAVGQQAAKLPARLWYAGLIAFVWEHRPWTVPLDSAWGVALLFVAVEFNYYWFHRASHRVRWFWASHAVHHTPTRLNLTSAYRLGWTAGVSGAGLLFLPLFALGFHPLAVFAALGANLLYQFWLHTELIPKLGPVEWVLNTPSHHRVHHASNDAYIDANYGGVLIVFDRVFGTFVEEDAAEPCRYGLAHRFESHNPIAIVFHEWARLWRDLRRATSPRAVLSAVFGPPAAPDRS
jgi:sterol desaturase/sphingolipid hydroxylase (fatty acid hydroxylase superfamily)